MRTCVCVLVLICGLLVRRLIGRSRAGPSLAPQPLKQSRPTVLHPHRNAETERHVQFMYVSIDLHTLSHTQTDKKRHVMHVCLYLPLRFGRHDVGDPPNAHVLRLLFWGGLIWVVSRVGVH